MKKIIIIHRLLGLIMFAHYQTSRSQGDHQQYAIFFQRHWQNMMFFPKKKVFERQGHSTLMFFPKKKKKMWIGTGTVRSAWGTLFSSAVDSVVIMSWKGPHIYSVHLCRDNSKSKQVKVETIQSRDNSKLRQFKVETIQSRDNSK